MKIATRLTSAILSCLVVIISGIRDEILQIWEASEQIQSLLSCL